MSEFGKWQPIESAPKDGSVILLWARGPEPFPAYWGMAKHACGAGQADAKYPWIFLDPTNGVNAMSEVYVSHWMPLPQPPEQRP